jgi:isopentenyl-diphosphate delta-isomerase
LWANACCTHPHWEEEPSDCAARRLKEELGVTTSLDFIYRNQIEYKADVGNGLVEHELVDIFTLKTNDIKNINIDINFAEVMAVRWVSFKDLKNEIIKNPEHFTPWLRIYLTEHVDQILAK